MRFSAVSTAVLACSVVAEARNPLFGRGDDTKNAAVAERMPAGKAPILAMPGKKRDDDTTTDGGDVATATDGDVATATDGDVATATDGDVATATDGDVATATDGDVATATDGDVATATDGDVATATDGDVATATDGDVATATDDSWTSTYSSVETTMTVVSSDGVAETSVASSTSMTTLSGSGTAPTPTSTDGYQSYSSVSISGTGTASTVPSPTAASDIQIANGAKIVLQFNSPNVASGSGDDSGAATSAGLTKRGVRTTGRFVGAKSLASDGSCAAAPKFQILDGKLLSGDSYISAEVGWPYMLFEASPTLRAISTTFSPNNGSIAWTNANFNGGAAYLCETTTGDVYFVFGGEADAPAGCGPIAVTAVLAASCDPSLTATTTTTAKLPSVTDANSTLILPQDVYFTADRPTGLACITTTEEWIGGATTVLA